MTAVASLADAWIHSSWHTTRRRSSTMGPVPRESWGAWTHLLTTIARLPLSRMARVCIRGAWTRLHSTTTRTRASPHDASYPSPGALTLRPPTCVTTPMWMMQAAFIGAWGAWTLRLQTMIPPPLRLTVTVLRTSLAALTLRASITTPCIRSMMVPVPSRDAQTHQRATSTPEPRSTTALVPHDVNCYAWRAIHSGACPWAAWTTQPQITMEGPLAMTQASAHMQCSAAQTRERRITCWPRLRSTPIHRATCPCMAARSSLAPSTSIRWQPHTLTPAARMRTMDAQTRGRCRIRALPTEMMALAPKWKSLAVRASQRLISTPRQLSQRDACTSSLGVPTALRATMRPMLALKTVLVCTRCTAACLWEQPTLIRVRLCMMGCV